LLKCGILLVIMENYENYRLNHRQSPETKNPIIFYDVDGTLAEPFESPPSELKKLLVALDEMGVIQVLCSGKNHEYLAGLARGLSLKKSNLVIAENGAVIFDWKNLKVINLVEDIEKLSEIRRQSRDHLAERVLYEEPKLSILTFFLLERIEMLGRTHQKIKKLADDNNLQLFSNNDGAIDLIPNGINKGNAIRRVILDLGLSEKEVITCGDSMNDMAMLEIGYPITFSNVHPDLIDLVKARQGYIARQPAPEGLIEAISNLSEIRNFENHFYRLPIAHRPWGMWEVLATGPGFKIKRMIVEPGHRLSLQMHKFRSEHWFIFGGKAQVTRGDEDLIILENETVTIPKNVKHRIKNKNEKKLIIIETQLGDYLEEDDIVRFEDDYNRR